MLAARLILHGLDRVPHGGVVAATPGNNKGLGTLS